MQSILGYGFLLKAPDDYPEGEYQETKAMVENLCKNAWKQCLNAKIEKMNFAIYAQDDIFITLSYRNEQIEFALFESSNKEIIQECSIFDFKKYVNNGRMDAFEYRIENECNAIRKGNILKRESLDASWEKKYREQIHSINEKLLLEVPAEKEQKNFCTRRKR